MCLRNELSYGQQRCIDWLLFTLWNVGRCWSVPLCIEWADRSYRITFSVYDMSFLMVSNIASIVSCLLNGTLTDVEAFLCIESADCPYRIKLCVCIDCLLFTLWNVDRFLSIPLCIESSDRLFWIKNTCLRYALSLSATLRRLFSLKTLWNVGRFETFLFV